MNKVNSNEERKTVEKPNNDPDLLFFIMKMKTMKRKENIENNE